MDLIRKKKEELELLLGTVSGNDRNKAAYLIQELLDSCSSNAETEVQPDSSVGNCQDDNSSGDKEQELENSTEVKLQPTPNIGRKSQRVRKKTPKAATTSPPPKKRKSSKKLEICDEVTPKKVKKEILAADEFSTVQDQGNEQPEVEFEDKPSSSSMEQEGDEVKINSMNEDNWFNELSQSEAKNENKSSAKRKKRKHSLEQRTNVFGFPKQVANTKSLTMFSKCFLCNDEETEYASVEEFKSHINSVHVEMNMQGRPVIKCPRCLEKYYLVRPPDKSLVMRNLVDVVVHFVRVHADKMIDFAKMYECPRCDFHSEEKKDWIEHLQAHLTEKVKCEICQKLVAQTSLGTHMKNMHNDDTLREFPCEHCGKFYASSAQVKYHVERVHFKTKNFKCIICDAAFYFKFDLERHMFVWHKQLSENHPIDTCDVCGFQTLRGNLMKKHMANHDSGEYTCEQCSKVFQTKNRWRSHMTIHNSNTIWKCTKCDYESKKKNHLDRHMTFTHGGVLFQCDLCSFKGTTERGILSHYSRTHGEAGVNLSCFKKIQLSEKPNFTPKKKKLRPLAEDNDKSLAAAFVQKVPVDKLPPEIVLKKESGKEETIAEENSSLNTRLPVDEVTCVMTGETNDDGTPVILSVQGEQGMTPTVADIQFVQNMLQINPGAFNSASTTSGTGDGVTVYHIVHSEELEGSDTDDIKKESS